MKWWVVTFLVFFVFCGSLFLPCVQLPFSPPMEAEFASLADTIKQYSFEPKGKFPPELKPCLTACAVRAIQFSEYGDNFFNRLPPAISV